MDFYLTCPPYADRKLEPNVLSAHHFVLQLLDLAVALFLDQEDQNRGPMDETYHGKPSNKASKEIVSTLGTIFAVGTAVLESVVSDDWFSRSVKFSSLNC
jgi:hypothetical protein